MAMARRSPTPGPAPSCLRPPAWATGPSSGIRRSLPHRPISQGRRRRMIVMDRENIFARGWSHALSTTNDLAELRAFCEQVGAPTAALHLNGRWPHLDLKLSARERALASAD